MTEGRGMREVFPPRLKSLPWPLLLIFLCMAFGIAVSSYFYYQKQKKAIVREQTGQLQVIADLKAANIEHWLKDRIGDARLITENPLLTTRLLTFLSEHASGRRPELIRQWMASLRNNFHYQNVMLLDKSGHVVLFLNEQYPALGDEGLDLIESVRRQKTAVISDLHISVAVPFPHLDISLPLIAHSEIFGFMLLRIDPAQFLYPMIQSWPTPSPSAETLLVRREGDSVLYLNRLRHREGTAMKLSFPINNTELPAAQAALGKTGAFSGRDYRGKAVWSVIRPITGTSWFLIAKIDREEIERPIRRKTLSIFMISLFLILAAALLILFLWQRQDAHSRLRQLESENQKQALVHHFDYLSRYANDIILLCDEKMNILETNERAVATYGYSREELLKMNVRDLRVAEERDKQAAQMRQIEEKQGLIFETVHQRKDGRIFPVESSIRVININEKKYFQDIVRDISERKQAEETLHESEAQFRQTFEFSPVGIVMVGLDKRFLRLNKAFSKSVGYTPEELIGKAIVDITYTDDIHIGMDEMKAIARGELAVSQVQKRYLHKDGRIIWGETTISLIRDHKANPQYFMAVIQDISERKRAEVALQESEDKFRYIFDNSVIGKSITLPDGEINVNQAFCNMLGYSLEEMKSRKWQNLTHPDDMNINQKALDSILSGETDSMRFEKRYFHKNGSIVWADVSTALRRDAAGKPLYFMTAVMDISERKRAEETVRKSEVRLRAILDATPFPIAIVDVQDDKIDFWSRSAFALFGHTAPTAAAWYEIAYPDPEYRREVIERWKPFLEKVRSSGQPVNTGEYRITCRDGSVRICELYATFLAENLIVTFNDITERKRVEGEIFQRANELAALNELGQQVSRSITLDEVAAVAVQGIIKTVQPDVAFLFLREGEKLTLTGIGQKSAVDKFSEMPEHRVGECMCGLAVTHGKPLYSRDIYSDQRCTWEECKKAGFRSFAALPLYSGTEIIGVIGLACQAERDFELQAEFLETMASQVVSGIRNAQLHAQVQHHAAELEQRVQQRTTQLEAANKELEAFSYSVSHDLRAPLRAISGFTQIILEENAPKLDKEARRLLDVITGNTRKMGQLIDDLLAFSRLSRQKMASAPVNLGAMANVVFSELKSQEKGRRIEFKIGALPVAAGDHSMLYQVLQNLLANAIKFTHNRSRARIEFSGKVGQGENIYQVKDNGVGFAMEYVDKLFGVFQRLHSADEFEGTGVGLAIVQRIILRHGGRVWAESSKKGGGATFYFTLPAEAASKTEVAPSQPEGEKAKK